MKVRIATRASELALVQARYVAARIESELHLATEILPMTTTGDQIQSVQLAKIGGKGLFVKEIEEALLENRADLAVHSAKDLPAHIPDGLVLAAFPVREDPRDALVSRDANLRLVTLPLGARVGTGSTRRMSQLLALRPDLKIVPLRGNVQTRLRKMVEQDLHAVVLACAGLERLQYGDRIVERIDTQALLPAVAQGTLALQTRRDDLLTQNIVDLNDATVEATIRAERSFLTRLEADCSVPVAGFAEWISEERLRMRGLVALPDGSRCLRALREGEAVQAEALGKAVAEELLQAGADTILRELRACAAREIK